MGIDGCTIGIAHINQCPLIVVNLKGSPSSKHCYIIWSYYNFDCKEIITTKLFEYMEKMSIGQKHQLCTQHIGHFAINEKWKFKTISQTLTQTPP